MVLLKEIKEGTSTYKCNLFKNVIELEKMTQTAKKEYLSMENKLREIYSILENNKNSLLIIRQTKLIPILSSLFKTISALHKSELQASLRTIYFGLKTFYLIASLETNRHYLLMTNQFSVLNTLLSCLLGK